MRVAENLTRQVYCEIRDQILRGEFNGQHLAESFFATRFDVSKAPIREALNRLEAEGLIVIRPRRGAWVPRFSEEDVKEIYQLCELLETAAMRKIMLNRQVIDRLQASLKSEEANLCQHNKSAYLLAHADFHSEIARATANSRLHRLLEYLQQQMLILQQQTVEFPDCRWVAKHRAILGALEKAKVEEAAQLMVEHIRAMREEALTSLQKPVKSNSVSLAGRSWHP